MSQRGNTLKLFSGILLAGLLTKQRACADAKKPLNGVFDLTPTAHPPQQHPLAGRHGILLTPEQPWTTHYRLAAW